jgi:hypothetical protein
MRHLLIILAAGYLLALPLSALAQSDGAPVQPPRADSIPVESWQTLEVREINQRLFDAIAVGEAWTRDPMELALRLFPLSSEGTFASVSRESPRGESPGEATITIVSDGLLDDSLRGAWTQVELTRSKEGTWRVMSLKRAYRCWRGCNRERFSQRLCP